nr:hypothetical protein [uncultured Flavobacterium sp.]
MNNDKFKEEKSVNIFYVLGALLIAKLFYSIFKSDSENNEQLQTVNNMEDDKTDSKSSIEKPKELGKNTFLHTTDNFGIMEKGRV